MNDIEALRRLKDITTRRRLPLALVDLGMNHRICEVGVWKGEFQEKLLECNPEISVMVDIWRVDPAPNKEIMANQETFEKFYQMALKKQWDDPRCYCLRMFSAQAAKLFAPHFFDCVYIDGDHTYEGVATDIAAWWPKIKPGGIISGHDYGRKRGVRKAVSEFVEQYGLQNRLHSTQEIAPSWFVMRPLDTISPE